MCANELLGKISDCKCKNLFRAVEGGIRVALDIKTVNQTVSSYVSDVKSVMPIDRVFLFGSYAKGTPNDDSDIDLCFFSHYFEDKKSLDLLSQLCRLTLNYRGVDIEPHVFPTSELQNDNPFVKEILRTGREI
jgi:predicted nucleotidyltransferase